MSSRVQEGEAVQEYYLGREGQNIFPKKTLVCFVDKSIIKRTAIAVVRLMMTQYAMKEAIRLVEPEPAESEAIRRVLFMGS